MTTKDNTSIPFAAPILREQILMTIFEGVEDFAIFTLDVDGKITSWSEGAHKIKQYTSKEAIGRHFAMLYPEEGRRRNEPMNHLDIASREDKFRGEGWRLRKNGEQFMCDASITPMYEGDNLAGYVKIVADLSARSKLIQERDLSRARTDRLEMERELRDRFIFTLSHDLRNPLTAAKMSSQLIARESCTIERHRDPALRCVQNIERVDKMITDLLDANRCFPRQSDLYELRVVLLLQ